MLNRFETVKKEEIKNLRALKARGAFPKPLAMKRPSFRDALVPRDGLPAVIAEYKRASPSRGLICDTISVEDTVSAYAENGASALSILTEEVYFKGELGFLARARERLDAGGFATPILRKDFIMDPLQVEMTFATPASALLLIVRMTPEPDSTLWWKSLTNTIWKQPAKAAPASSRSTPATSRLSGWIGRDATA